jgi:hypothetical protein
MGNPQQHTAPISNIDFLQQPVYHHPDPWDPLHLKVPEVAENSMSQDISLQDFMWDEQYGIPWNEEGFPFA